MALSSAESNRLSRAQICACTHALLVRFVNTAIESASADKDIATIKQAQQRLMLLESLRDVFQESRFGRADSETETMDCDRVLSLGNRELSRNEFAAQKSDVVSHGIYRSATVVHRPSLDPFGFLQEMAGNNDARVSLGELQQAIDTNNTLGISVPRMPSDSPDASSRVARGFRHLFGVQSYQTGLLL